ncbi:MAG: hypothetical protein WDA25_01155 [Paracoccaceae bacterium]
MGDVILTPTQKELARHALGLPNKRKQTYRNHFMAGPGHSDYGEWTALVDADLARRRSGNELTGGDDLFWLTYKGAKAALNPGERLDPEDFAND